MIFSTFRFIALCSCISCLVLGSIYSYRWVDQYLHFVTCDVGQGDALLLQFGFTQILIDAGKDALILQCLDNHMPFWDRTIEMLVITHPDFDHYGGVSEVLDRYTVHTLAQLPLNKNDSQFVALQALVQTKRVTGMQVINPTSGDEFWIANSVRLKTLWPLKKTIEKLPKDALLSETLLSDEHETKVGARVDGNPLSITLLVTYKEINLLLTGDLDSEGELALARSDLMVKVDVLKVGHHGSKTSSAMSFLSTIRPEIAVVSVGKNNQYHHPDMNVLHNLEELVEQNIFRTDLQGEIHLFTDGYQIWKK